jgi:hypothetical protein
MVGATATAAGVLRGSAGLKCAACDQERCRNMAQNQEPQIETLMETENYVAWVSQEEDGSMVYHVELGSVTLHLLEDEWRELIDLIDGAVEVLEADDE